MKYYLNKKNGKITPAEAQAQINNLRGLDVRNEFEKYFYSKAINQQYSVSLNGGSNNFAWNLASGYDNNKDHLSTENKRLNVNFNSKIQISKRLQLENSVYFTNAQTVYGKPGYGSITTMNGLPPYTQFADQNGSAIALYNNSRQGYIDTLGKGKILNWNYYPLDDYKNINNRSTINDFNATVGLKYSIFEGLDFGVIYRFEKQSSTQRTLYDVNSFYARNLINSFVTKDIPSGTLAFRIPVGGILDNGLGNTKAQNFRAQLNYNKGFAKHNINFLAGSEINEKISDFNSHRTYGYDNGILSYANVDYANSYYSNYLSLYQQIPSNVLINGNNIRFLSFFSNAGYSYDNRYLASVSVRTDASNTFGVKTRDKFEPQYSAGLGWNVSNETFYKFGPIPFLKLRITHGIQGNVDPSKVALTTLSYTGINNPYTQYPTSMVVNYANPSLKWERVAITNLGLDFGLKGGRVSGSIEMYRKKTTDMLGPDLIDPTIGQGTIVIKNVGTLYGKGIDFELKTLNIDKTFKWRSDLIINHSTDKMGKVNIPPATSVSSIVSGVVPNIEGYPVYGYFAFKSAGLNPLNGSPRGIINGKVTSNYDSLFNVFTLSDLKYVGRLFPSLYGSIGNTFSYKNLSISARLVYKFGYYFRRISIQYSNLTASNNVHSDFAKRWKTPGDELTTNIPSFIYPANPLRDQFFASSDALAEKGDHIRLQYITVNYKLDNLVSKLPFKSLSIYSSINNVGIVWRKNKQGIDLDNINGYKTPVSYSIGLSTNF